MAQKTKQRLMDSLVGLLREKPLSKITISDIVNDCGLSRATFYYYFKDIYDQVSCIFQERGKTILAGMPVQETWQSVFYVLCSDMYQNQEFLYRICHQVTRIQIEDFLFQFVRGIVSDSLDRLEDDTGVEKDDRELVVRFYSYAFTGFVLEWIQHGMKESPETLTYHVSAMVDGHIRQTLHQFRDYRVWAKPDLFSRL